MDHRLQAILDRIQPLDAAAQEQARARQDMLTKPRGSMGRLEDLSIQLAGIFGQPLPTIRNKVVVTMAGDHGVVAEGVSAYPQEVTPQMVYNFLRGGAAINVLARHVGARVVVVDVGVAADLEPHPDLIIKKVAYGTENIARGPAMTQEQAVQALLAGVEVVEQLVDSGLDIVGTGDMGIANTTPSAAIARAMTGHSAADLAGRGTGVDDAGLSRKIAVIEQAVAVNRPDPQNALDVLAKVGGYEIAGIAGVILGAAAHHRPAVIDGFISTAAALIAVGLAPQVRPYLIAAHCSQEKGHRIMLEWMGLKPLLDLDMRVGEGTGAVLGLSLAEAACKILCEMATFGEAGVSDKE
ncbi:MAG: nicotinate-nucleotide--dimethylbenzimidazole phosphoribosyltransferase [Chloroflexi bacterium]|jgi:nicotinate-nucleotide--dimethylbenzimidazole phosphoribosyltransferase|nr:nicotinate-nucleotide--dimethylbenzimidazole phosphoribosyltransferase [Chloroflexota bacterium]